MKRLFIVASVLVTLATSVSAFGQGPGNGNGNGNGKGNGKGNGNGQGNGKGQGQTKVSSPPSRNELASPVAIVAGPTSAPGATPLAWIDDATVLEPGATALGISILRWGGADLSETDAPIIDGAVGVASRVQVSGSVPRVVGSSDADGAAGGIGTSFFSVKVGVFQNHARSFKIAVAPTLEVLGPGVASALGPDASRTRFGLPVSLEFDRGVLRVYGGGGHFSPGLWFGGAAVGTQLTPTFGVTVGFSRAWRADVDDATTPLSERDRKELSVGASHAFTPQVSVFGSLSRTITTLDVNGAGSTIAGGVSLFFSPGATAKPTR